MPYLLVFSLLVAGLVPPRLVKTELAEGVTAELPEDFTALTDDYLANRYPSYRKPVVVLTDPTGQVDVGFNRTPSNFRPQDLPILQSFYRASLLQMFDEVDFLRQEIEEVNKRPYAVFEFTAEVREQGKRPIRRYTYVQYAIVGQETHIFRFTCPAELQQTWQPVAGEIMRSVKIKR